MKKQLQNSICEAVTLLELLVVVLIISILATIATGVYTGQTRRARIAATEDLIRQLDMAITRYEVDTGSFPPSGTGTTLEPPAVSSREDGSGYLHLALVHSLSGNALVPASALWDGPYINVQSENLLSITPANPQPGSINFLDSWGNPIIYVKAEDYSITGATFNGGTETFSGTMEGADPDLPAPNPFRAQGETFYNPTTYQLISFGPDGDTLRLVIGGFGQFQFLGTDPDDINNFGY